MFLYHLPILTQPPWRWWCWKIFLNKWLLLLISSALFALPFLASAYCWWLIFFFPLPLFIASHTYDLSFKEGFFWMGGTFFLHSGGAMFSTIQSGIGPYWLRITPFVLVTFYYALVGALFFWVCDVLIRKFSIPFHIPVRGECFSRPVWREKCTNRDPMLKLCLTWVKSMNESNIKSIIKSVWFDTFSSAKASENTHHERILYRAHFTWLICIWFLFIFIDRYSFTPLWFFERVEGYFLMLPLLPLAQYPKLLLLLPWVGKNMLILFLLLPAWSGVLGYVNKPSPPLVPSVFRSEARKMYRGILFLFILSLLPWIASLLMPISPPSKPPWLDHIVCLQKKFTVSSNMLHTTRSMAMNFREIIEKYPATELIIMPESACFLEEVAEEPILTQYWKKNMLGKEMHIIFGGCRYTHNHYYNSLYWYLNENVQAVSDKRHTMLLTERLPQLLENSYMHDAYFGELNSFDISHQPRSSFIIFRDVIFIPYICSELFFTQYPDDQYTHDIILAICGDAWAHHSYIGKLMFLMAQLRAIEWQRDIVYCSYQHAAFLTQSGDRYLVRTKC